MSPAFASFIASSKSKFVILQSTLEKYSKIEL